MKIHSNFIILLIAIALLFGSCSPKVVEYTSKTTVRSFDSLVVIPESKINFISLIPDSGDTLILTDRKTGVKLIIKEFIKENNTETTAPEQTTSNNIKDNKEYEFEIIQPEKEIRINFTETVTEENKTVSKIPWYYKLSFKILVFLFALGLMIYLLKKFLP